MMLSIKPVIMLLLGIIFTSIIWYGFIFEEEKIAKNEFDSRASNIVDLVINRLSHHEQVLLGAKGLFLSSDEVTYVEWQDFIHSQEIKQRYPGIQGVGYVEHVNENNVSKLENKMNNYGIDDFKIHPEGIREEYYPVIFLHPMDIRNQKALGYDIYSEETRKKAIDLSVTTGETTITDKIILVQEDESLGKIQNGFLMLMPLYDDKNNSDQPLGFPYAVFRMDNFIYGLLDAEQFETLNIKIYDGSKSEDSLFFDSRESYTNPDLSKDFSITLNENFGNSNWEFQFEGTSLYSSSNALLIAIPLAGYSLSGLLFYLFYLSQKTLILKRRELASIKENKVKEKVIEQQNQALIEFTNQKDNICVCTIDIKCSTKITSKLSDAQTSRLYGKFLNFTAGIIQSHQGVVVKNVGDAILFYFDCPNPHKKSEFTRVLGCCMDLIEQKDELDARLKDSGLPSINFRISSTYGSVMIAKILKFGTPDIFGSTVNQTFKINRLSKTNGLVISDRLYEKVKTTNGYKFKESTEHFPTEFGYSVYHVSKIAKFYQH